LFNFNDRTGIIGNSLLILIKGKNMKNKILLKFNFFLILFYLFLVIVGCGESATGPGNQSINPFNENFLFLEYRIYTYGETEKDSVRFFLERYNSCYSFNDFEYMISIDTLYQKKIDTTNRFIFGSVTVLGPMIGMGIVGILQGYSSFILTDSMSNPPFTYGHQIKMLDYNAKGETKISFDNKEFNLKPKEIFQDTITRTHIALQIKNRIYHYSYINDIIIIRNFGFINKKNIRYYNSSFDY